MDYDTAIRYPMIMLKKKKYTFYREVIQVSEVVFSPERLVHIMNSFNSRYDTTVD